MITVQTDVCSDDGIERRYEWSAAVGQPLMAPAVLLFGSLAMLAGTFGLQLLGDHTPIATLLAITVVMGIPNGLNSLGLQTGLYAASPPERIGSSGGLYQTFRYLGAILASSVLGVLLERDLSTTGLHQVGLVACAAAVVLVLLALSLPRNLGRFPQD